MFRSKLPKAGAAGLAVLGIGFGMVMGTGGCATALGTQRGVSSDGVALRDRAEILDLISKYSHAFDDGAIDEWVALFAEGASFEIPSMNVSLRGHAELRDWAAGRIAARDPEMRIRHHATSTLLFRVAKDRVRSRTMVWLVIQPRDGSLPVTGSSSGVYESELSKTASGWRFQSRVADADLPLDREYFDGP
jgi:3-phenylpropionate/cinnamic acid dioxygenase small subunit